MPRMLSKWGKAGLGWLLLLPSAAHAQAAFYNVANFAVHYRLPATVFAAALFVAMILRPRTRTLLIVPLALFALCLGPYIVFSYGHRSSGGEVELNALGLLYAAPSVFLISAACAWTFHAMRSSATAGIDEASPERVAGGSMVLALNLCFAIAMLIAYPLFRPYHVFNNVPLEWLTPAQWIGLDTVANWIARIHVPTAFFVVVLIDQILLAIVLLFVFRRLRADRWIDTGARGWELLALANVLEIMRALAVGLTSSGDASARIFIFTVPLMLVVLAGLLMMLFSHFIRGVRGPLSARRTVGSGP